MSGLAKQVYEERLKNLEENEKHLAEGIESDDDDESDEDEDGLDQDPSDMFKNTRKALMKAKNEDEDDDEDYEGDDFADKAGEFALYDSPLE